MPDRRSTHSDMALQTKSLIIFVILLLHIKNTSGTTECLLKNTSCSDLRVAEGFRFGYDCPKGSAISVEGTNKTHLAHADKYEQHFDPDIINMDNHSVITKTCQDLTITCIIATNGLEEKCVSFKTISDSTESPPPQHKWGLEWIVAIVAIPLIFLYIPYHCWKKRWRNQQCPTLDSQCLPGNQDGSGFRMVETGGLGGQPNGDIGNGGDPRGSGETDQHTLESVTSEDIGARSAPTPSDPNPVNGFRNMREDPGGKNTTKGREIKRELDGGGAAEHYQAEEQPLLPDLRAASAGGADVAGEAVALVNELSFDQDRVECSRVTDVESTCTGKLTNGDYNS
ncbi:uncharacterized protein LOC105931992 isoform X2 [Fundulus heteroclitus]|uniref:uncharacterized protein LOC105931992 isoform X2 n=1 Tax=Fundulus heteroclitus TaxID=8078 RepID=UPI00165BF5A3|nr:uncharacterized protein LOC105931992 isoform X2 [Fundulus heteroclitus]